MQQNQTISPVRAQIIEAIAQAEDWQSGNFEGVSPPLFFIHSAIVASDQTGFQKSINLQFIFSYDALSGEARNINLQVTTLAIPSSENSTRVAVSDFQKFSGGDIDAAFFKLQAEIRAASEIQADAQLPEPVALNVGAAADTIEKLQLEIADGAVPIKIDDTLLEPYATTLIPFVRSICKFDEAKARALFSHLDKLRLVFLLAQQTASPNYSGVLKSVKAQWPAFEANKYNATVRALLRLINPREKCLSQQVSRDYNIQNDALMANLHTRIIRYADQAMLANLRLAVTGQSPSRHKGLMSNLPARITLGEGGIVPIGPDKRVELPLFRVTSVELPLSVRDLSERNLISEQEYHRYELLNISVNQETATGYDLLPHLTPDELEQAAEQQAKLAEMSEFERLLEIGSFIDSRPYYSHLPLQDILRLSFSTTEVEQFNRLINLLKKAQGIEALLNPTEEMAASMRFWGIDADKAQSGIKFDRRIEEIVARVAFYDDGASAKNRMVRGNEGYRSSTEPMKNGAALVMEAFLASEVNSKRLALLATPVYLAVAEIVEHFDRAIRPLTHEYNARFEPGGKTDRPVVAELLRSVRFLRSLKDFYEGYGRASGLNYLTWRQVQVGQQVMAEYELKLNNFLALYRAGEKDQEENQFEIPALN